MICIPMCITNNIENLSSLIFVLHAKGDPGLLGLPGIPGPPGEEVMFNFLLVENLSLGYWMWMFKCLSVGGQYVISIHIAMLLWNYVHEENMLHLLYVCTKLTVPFTHDYVHANW